MVFTFGDTLPRPTNGNPFPEIQVMAKSGSNLTISSDAFKESKKTLLKEYKLHYKYWLFQLAHGFNLLMHGLGSKKRVLADFSSRHLSRCSLLTVDGYNANISIKEILTTLSSSLSNNKKTFKNHLEHANFICKCLESQSRGGNSPEVFLLIHNIDGPSLRSDSAQTALSVLAASPFVHVIASVDHIHAPLLWDERKLGRFNWAWHDVTTFAAYECEAALIGSSGTKQSDSITLASLKSVMQGLTSNACGIFRILVQYQLDYEEEEGSSYLGMLFADCYTKCRNGFLVNSNLTFKMYLVEFTDHKLLKYRYGQDGGEYLYVPVDRHKLSTFMKEQRGTE